MKNLVFDWSGTILDSLARVQSVYAGIFNHYGLNAPDIAYLRRNFTIPYMDFWNRHIPQMSFEEQNILYDRFTSQATPCSLFPDAARSLKALTGSGIVLFVLSSDSSTHLLEEAERGGIRELFVEIVCHAHHKDVAISELLTRHALDPAQTCYVGDTCGDIESARRAGIRTMAVTWGFQDPELLRAAEPDFMVNDFDELVALATNRKL